MLHLQLLSTMSNTREVMIVKSTNELLLLDCVTKVILPSNLGAWDEWNSQAADAGNQGKKFLSNFSLKVDSYIISENQDQEGADQILFFTLELVSAGCYI